MPPKYIDDDIFTGGIVRVTVGTIHKVSYDIHRKLLYRCSPYFRSPLKFRPHLDTHHPPDEFDELHLPDDQPQVFADFIFWAYYGEILSRARYLSFDDSPFRVFHLYRLWTLAGKLKVQELQDLAMVAGSNELAEHPSELVDTHAVLHAYSNSSEGSALRRLAVRVWAERATKSVFLEHQKDLPRGFLMDLNGAWLEKKNEANSTFTITKQTFPPPPPPGGDDRSDDFDPLPAPIFLFQGNVSSTDSSVHEGSSHATTPSNGSPPPAAASPKPEINFSHRSANSPRKENVAELTTPPEALFKAMSLGTSPSSSEAEGKPDVSTGSLKDVTK